ncbi:hypothetical protein PHLGIDRAFT_327394 [Phlebiopsis gigantea 11061_1 CR5-6]|uniref:Cyanovirin-N domain-containing protein n=1 Tax=Phlebiopsis gigantea (strain 11061_1 CR5-6) TaxID=745531 RepID=A0A0C3P2T4_PHLG1|nr:hypothetical protein PHLGIDRAFT_327394 [Phlebiopsis gigantea 11061_1 CR5-6]
MFTSAKSFSALVAIALITYAAPATAVCSSGQMAVGRESLQEFTGPNGSFEEYSGFLMANNCGLISQNGVTQNFNQLCSGGYNAGASVSCDGNHNPIAAVDTSGNHWNCSPTSDSSCDVGGSGGFFEVLACCSRA